MDSSPRPDAERPEVDRETAYRLLLEAYEAVKEAGGTRRFLQALESYNAALAEWDRIRTDDLRRIDFEVAKLRFARRPKVGGS